MADSTTDIPIYELPDATNIQKTDLAIIEQANGDKKAKLSDFTYLPSEVDANIKIETDRAKEAEQTNANAIADKELKSYSLTLAVADVVANTDEYATETVDHSAYPYCVNHAMSDVTADTQAHINYSSNMAVQDRSWKTLAGVFRIYLKSMPTAAIDIQFTLQKGTVVA